MRQRLITIFVILLLLGLTMWAMPHRNEGKETDKKPESSIFVIEKWDKGNIYRVCIDGYEYIVISGNGYSQSENIIQALVPAKEGFTKVGVPKPCGGNQ